MPNHVTNILKVVDAGGHTDIIQSCLNEEGRFDFDLVVPQPECLKGFQPHSGIMCRAKLALGLVPNPKSVDGEQDYGSMANNLSIQNMMRDAVTPMEEKDLEDVIRAMRNYFECGFMYWYDWNVAKRGTKWGAYDQTPFNEEENSIQFDTAWSTPMPIFSELADRFPEATFELIFADEDTGSNCGRLVFKGDDVITEDISPGWGKLDDAGKAKWTEFAFNVRYSGQDPKSHGYDENWVYSEEVYDAWVAENED